MILCLLKVDLTSDDEEEMVPRPIANNRRVIQDDSDEEMVENKDVEDTDGKTPFKKTIASYRMTETPDSPSADTNGSFATPAPRIGAILGQTPASRIGSGLGSSKTPASRIGLGSSSRTPATGSSWKSGPPSTAASSRSFKQKNAERYAWLEYPKDAQKREFLC
jgi:hypothetical protein